MAENTENEKRYPKRIPYGMMNFVNVRERDCYYVDKTRFIEKIEDSNMFFFFIRPRRFGKSLTMSMLQHYYDVNDADKFDMLYKGL
ncbi:MAG TPA: AAA family ATPase, partial [Prevotella sp.]|nr:AAA family ATPase [Prevotella sp.]